MRLNRIAAAVLGAGLMASCATATTSADDFTAKWDAADAKRMEAAALGYEWRDTEKMLKSAKKEAEAGNTDKAMKLVAQAHEQSADAIVQAEREGSLWQARVPQ